MRFLIPLFFSLIFFTSCSINQAHKTTSPFKISKQKLISKANKGDLKSILLLDKYYDFPKTVEGLEYFTKWFDIVKTKSNEKDFYKITNIYYDNQDMFINGTQKSVELLNLALKSDNYDAGLKLLQYYIKKYDKYNQKLIEEKILNNLNEKQLGELYSFYMDKYKRKEAKKVIEIIKNKSYSLPKQYYIKQISTYFYKKDEQSKKEYQNLIDEIKLIKNPQILYDIALNSYYKRYKYDIAIELFNKVIQLDKNNSEVYLKLSEIYSLGSRRYNIQKDKEKTLKYLITSHKKGNNVATAKLFKFYSKKPKYLKEYLNIKKELENSQEGLLEIAKYYKYKGRYEKEKEILTKLANERNEDAIIKLALKRGSKYSYYPEDYETSTKWVNYIKNSDNVSLQKKFYKEISSYRYKKTFKDILDDRKKEKNPLIKNSDNILELRKRYLDIRYKNMDDYHSSLKEVAKTNDKYTIKKLANLYRYGGGKYKQNLPKYIETINILVTQGDIDSMKELADFYYYKKDTKEKALKLYEKLALKGDKRSLKKLAKNYLCGECNESKNLDYKKAFYYLEKLEDIDDGEASFSIGWMYHFGKGVKKDLEIAKKYYEKAALKNNIKALFNLGWLFYEKEGLRKDYKKAFNYYKKAADLVYAKAANQVGYMYELGQGVKKDTQKAIEYYEKGYRGGDKHAIYNLGIIYLKGKYGVKKDINLAKKLFKQSNTNSAREELKKLNN